MFPAKDADKEEDRRDEPGQDDHHDHLIMMARLEMNMNINMNMNMTMTLCPVRHALYLVASLTEQNLQRNDKTSDHHDHHHQDLPVNSD